MIEGYSTQDDFAVDRDGYRGYSKVKSVKCECGCGRLVNLPNHYTPECYDRILRE